MRNGSFLATLVLQWVVKSLHRTPFVVVRRGLATWPVIPVGVRGVDRNQRWAATCAFNLVKSILAPPQLLRRSVAKSREDAIPAFRALNLMKERWRDLDYPWGPGGSIGFELAAGTNIAKPESDLDLVIYAAERITREMAQVSTPKRRISLLLSTFAWRRLYAAFLSRNTRRRIQAGFCCERQTE